MSLELTKALQTAAGEENVLVNEPMSLHTTFRIGGPADYFVSPGDEESLREVIRICRETQTPFTLIGNGSNLLVGDGGYRGVVICLARTMSEIRVEGDTITAEAGAMLSSVAREAYNASLTGLEFAAGIPGTLGGGVIMNAGAYGGELKQVIESVRLMTAEGEIVTRSCEEMEFGYRTSRAMKDGSYILSATIKLEKGDQSSIKEIMDDLKDRRVSKQPLDLPSAGSTFKRPEGYFAGKLIMDSGLAGFTVGGAQVSEKHCGFVVNRGGATAKDVRSLMQQVEERVLADYGVTLEPEVRFLGEFE